MSNEAMMQKAEPVDAQKAELVDVDRRYRFEPAADITAHEIALILQRLDIRTGDKMLGEWPDGMKRHFKVAT
jgi:hypothetical protein